MNSRTNNPIIELLFKIIENNDLTSDIKLEQINCAIDALKQLEPFNHSFHAKETEIYEKLNQAIPDAKLETKKENMSLDATNKENGATLLIYAIRTQDPKIVNALLEAGASPNQAAAGIPPLHFAIHCLNDANNANDIVEIIKSLLRAGASATQSGEDSNCSNKPLFFAVKQIKDCKVEREVVKSLIEFKAAPDAEVLCCAMANNETDVVKELLTAGVDPNEMLPNGYFPLTQAILKDNNELISVLLESRAMPNPPNYKNGWLPLSCAIHKDNLEAVKLLLKVKADPCLFFDNDGKLDSPLTEAISENQTEYLKMLLEAKASLNQPVCQASLVYAAETGRIEAVKELLAAGTDVNASDIRQGYIPKENEEKNLSKNYFESFLKLDSKSQEKLLATYRDFGGDQIEQSVLILAQSLGLNNFKFCFSYPGSVDDDSEFITSLQERLKDSVNRYIPIVSQTREGTHAAACVIDKKERKIFAVDPERDRNHSETELINHLKTVRSIIGDGVEEFKIIHAESKRNQGNVPQGPEDENNCGIYTAIIIFAILIKQEKIQLKSNNPEVQKIFDSLDIDVATAKLPSSKFLREYIGALLLALEDYKLKLEGNNASDNNEGTKLHWKDSNPLIIACVKNQDEIVEILMNAKALPNLESKQTKETALHWAAYNNNQNIALQLILANAKLDSLNENERTPLEEAIFNKSLATISLLLSKGQTPNSVEMYNDLLLFLKKSNQADPDVLFSYTKICEHQNLVRASEFKDKGMIVAKDELFDVTKINTKKLSTLTDHYKKQTRDKIDSALKKCMPSGSHMPPAVLDIISCYAVDLKDYVGFFSHFNINKQLKVTEPKLIDKAETQARKIFRFIKNKF